MPAKRPSSGHREGGAVRLARAPGGPLALVAAALWAGLVVGLVESALFLARVRFLQHGLYRKSPHVLWMIPAADLAIFGAAGLLLAAVVRPLPRAGGSLARWLLCILALMTPLLAIPGLRMSSCLLLAVGLSCWVAPTVRAHAEGFTRLIRWSLPPLGLALLALVGVALARGRPASSGGGAIGGAARAGAPNVLLIVMDTVRADATSLGGSARATTPNLATLARRGARFERAIATAPWTLPSHASLFTGRWAWELGVGPYRALDSRRPTLAEYLGRHGYATAGFVANSLFCGAEYGLGRGFRHYEDYVVSPLDALRSTALGWLICRRLEPVLDRLCAAAGREAAHPLDATSYRKDAAEINRAALGWLAGRGDRPFFVFLNYFDAHDPYLVPGGAGRPFTGRPFTPAERWTLRRGWIDETPRARTPGRIRLARDAYDDCLAYLDGQIGGLLAELGRLGRLANTVIVVTADHGEHFGEHTRNGSPLLGHGLGVYQQEIHVPLLIVAPGRVPAGAIVRGAVSLRDLPGTIVDLVGLGAGSPFPGPSLLAPPAGAGTAPGMAAPGAALAEFSPEPDPPVQVRSRTGTHGPMRAVVADGKVYHRQDGGREELYDIKEDPRESKDLARSPRYRGVLDQLRSTLDRLAPPG